MEKFPIEFFCPELNSKEGFCMAKKKNFFTSTPFYILLFVLLFVIIIIVPVVSILHDSQDDVPILVYHDIVEYSDSHLNLTKDQFYDQMQYLKEENYSVITIDQLLEAWQSGTKLPKNPVVITFDGGYAGVVQNAFPILQENHFPATIFLATDYIGTDPRYLDWSQVAQMDSSGLIQFESNTLNRQPITRLPTKNDQLFYLTTSKQTIEWKMHTPVNYVAYPLGVYTVDTLQESRNAGYKAAFAIDYGFAKKGEKSFVYGRVPIFENGSGTFSRFKFRLKYAPIVKELKSVRDTFIDGGYDLLSNLIPVP